MGIPSTSRGGIGHSARSMAGKLRKTKTAEPRLSEREHEPSDGGGIHLLIDELKRWQVMPTESSALRYSGKRSVGDDRVFAFLRSVAVAELEERDRFLPLEGGVVPTA